MPYVKNIAPRLVHTRFLPGGAVPGRAYEVDDETYQRLRSGPGWGVRWADGDTPLPPPQIPTLEHDRAPEAIQKVAEADSLPLLAIWRRGETRVTVLNAIDKRTAELGSA